MTPETLFPVMDATWPPARSWRHGPFLLRDGAGGGKRVSAASVVDDWSAADLAATEAAMTAPLFLIRPQDGALDRALEARGYAKIDPVVAYAAPVAVVAGDGPKWMTTFPHWPPMEIARSLWAEGGIGPARLAVMERVAGPKTAILGRSNDRAAGPPSWQSWAKWQCCTHWKLPRIFVGRVPRTTSCAERQAGHRNKGRKPCLLW